MADFLKKTAAAAKQAAAAAVNAAAPDKLKHAANAAADKVKNAAVNVAAKAAATAATATDVVTRTTHTIATAAAEAPQDSKMGQFLNFASKVAVQVSKVAKDSLELFEDITTTESNVINCKMAGGSGAVITRGDNAPFFHFLKGTNSPIEKVQIINGDKDLSLDSADSKAAFLEKLLEPDVCLKVAHSFLANSSTQRIASFDAELGALYNLKSIVPDNALFEKYSNLYTSGPNIMAFKITFKQPISYKWNEIVSETKFIYVILMKYCITGDLNKLMSSLKDKTNPNPMDIFKNVGDFLTLIHSNFYGHCDIKLENIIYCDSGYQIIDFGSMSKKTENLSYTEYCTLPILIDAYYSEREELKRKYKISKGGERYVNKNEEEQYLINSLYAKYYKNRQARVKAEYYCYCKSREFFNDYIDDVSRKQHSYKKDKLTELAGKYGMTTEQYLLIKNDEFALAVVLLTAYDPIEQFQKSISNVHNKDSLFSNYLTKNIKNYRGNFPAFLADFVNVRSIIDKLLRLDPVLYIANAKTESTKRRAFVADFAKATVAAAVKRANAEAAAAPVLPPLPLPQITEANEEGPSKHSRSIRSARHSHSSRSHSKSRSTGIQREKFEFDNAQAAPAPVPVPISARKSSFTTHTNPLAEIKDGDKDGDRQVSAEVDKFLEEEMQDAEDAEESSAIEAALEKGIEAAEAPSVSSHTLKGGAGAAIAATIKYNSRSYKVRTHQGKKCIKTKEGYILVKDVKKAEREYYDSLSLDKLKRCVKKNKHAAKYAEAHNISLNSKKALIKVLAKF